MNEDQIYYKDANARILELLKDTFKDTFKAYFDGDAEPGESYLPCVMVSSQTTNVDTEATGTDNLQESIIIIVAFNKKDDLGARPDQQLTEYRLRKIILGQDPDTSQYLPQTFMGVLRTHFTLDDGIVIDNRISIDFAPNIRSTNIPTQEAYITVNINRLAIVPSRS